MGRAYVSFTNSNTNGWISRKSYAIDNVTYYKKVAFALDRFKPLFIAEAFNIISNSDYLLFFNISILSCSLCNNRSRRATFSS